MITVSQISSIIQLDEHDAACFQRHNFQRYVIIIIIYNKFRNRYSIE